MRYGSAFTRESARGELVGVVKYKDASGAWRQRSKTFHGPRAEAEAAYLAWLGSLGAAPPRPRAPAPAPAGGAASLADLVLECLSSELARGRIERSTYESQLGYARVHVLPALGSLRPSELTLDWLHLAGQFHEGHETREEGVPQWKASGIRGSSARSSSARSSSYTTTASRRRRSSRNTTWAARRSTAG